MKIKPMNDRVLVLRVEEEQKTAGGIIIPDTGRPASRWMPTGMFRRHGP